MAARIAERFGLRRIIHNSCRAGDRVDRHVADTCETLQLSFDPVSAEDREKVGDFERTEDQMLSAAAAVEAGSDHPLAQAILRRAAPVKAPKATGFKNLEGKGAQAGIVTWSVPSSYLMRR